jgi:hypothetical protein
VSSIKEIKPETNTRGAVPDKIEDARPRIANSLIQLPPRSVNADGLQLVAPGVGDRRFPAIGQHDRLAARGVEREQL